MLDASFVTSLYGGSLKSQNKLHNLVTGNANSVLETAMQSLKGDASNLNETQSSALESVKDYIMENVEDDEMAAKLLAELATVEDIMSAFNSDSSVPDSVFSLLSGNADMSDLPAGSLINQLL